MIRRSFYLLLLILLSGTICNAQKKFTLIIDAGHGGKDPGAVGKLIKEKDITLDIALKFGKMVEENMSDVNVVYTRKTDKFIHVNDRPGIANKAKGDLFVSIHVDALPPTGKNAQISGASTFTLGMARTNENLEVAKRENSVILLEDDYETRYEGFDPNKDESYIIFDMLQNTHQAQSINAASYIQTQLTSHGQRKNRSVRQAGFYVLRSVGMPSILVEAGFITNPEEEKFLSTQNGRKRIAESIYRGFVNYKKDYDKYNETSGITASKESGINKDTQVAGNTGSTGNARATSSSAGVSTNTVKNEATSHIVYKIQFLSSNSVLKNNDPKLKGIKPVEYYQEGGLYKYTYGRAKSASELQREMTEIKKKFKDAFIVRFKDGKRLK